MQTLFRYCADSKTAELVVQYTHSEQIDHYLNYTYEKNRPIVQALWKKGRREKTLIAALTTCVCEEEMVEAIKEVIKKKDEEFAINLAARSFGS